MTHSLLQSKHKAKARAAALHHAHFSSVDGLKDSRQNESHRRANPDSYDKNGHYMENNAQSNKTR
jgi:hypothetical protein